MTIQVSVNGLKHQPKLINLENGGQIKVTAGDTIKLQNRADLKTIKKGSDLIVKDAHGNEYILKDFYKEVAPSEKGQMLTWEDELGTQKELLSQDQTVLIEAASIDEGFGMFVSSLAGMGGIYGAIANNHRSSTPDTANNTIGKLAYVDTIANTVSPSLVISSIAAVDDAVTVNAGKPFNSSVSLLANDIEGSPDKVAVAGTYSTAQGGTLVLANNGHYTYTPPAGFSGTDTVSYTITDSLLSDSALLTITVNPLPTAIVTIDAIGIDSGAYSDFITSDNDGLWVSFTLNESLKPDETVWYSNDNGVTWQDLGPINGYLLSTLPDGTIIERLGSLFFDAELTETNTVQFQVRNANGIAGPTTYQLITIDTTTPTTTAVVTTVIDDAGIVQGPVTNGGVTDDTSLVLNGTLSAPLNADETVRIYDGATYLGEATITGTNWTYTDSTLANGDITSYTAQVADLADNQSVASTAYTVSVNPDIPAPVNQAPVAVDDAVTVIEDTPFTSAVSLLANDTDVDGPSKLAVAGTFVTAQGGSLVLAANGSYTYTPATGFSGTDTVSYSVTDGTLTDSGLLTITVSAVNEAPVAATSYADNVGTTKNTASIAASSDDATPGINIGAGLTETPNLYVNNIKVAATYDSTEGTLTPINPLAKGAHTFTYTLTNTSGDESIQNSGIAINTTATIYYVSPTGIDTNNGTSIASSLRTIKAALTKAVSGDTVYLLTGTYEE